MNGTEQTKHRRATDALDTRLENVETVLDALDDRVSKVAAAALKSIGEERTARLKLAEEQRGYVDRGDKTLDQMIRGLRDRGWWGRLRWLVRGR